MAVQLKLTTKNVYGRVLGYPACEASKRLALAFKIKSFTLNQVKTIRSLGLGVVLVAEPLTTEETA